MPRSIEKSRLERVPGSGRIQRCERIIGITSIILSLLAFACQTSGDHDPRSKDAQVLDSQKAIVRNALDTGRPEAALETMRQMLRDHPDDASLQNLMGLTQLSLKNSSRAIKHFQIAYKLDRQVGTGLNLSSALIENGDIDRATRLLGQLTKQADKDKYPYKERIYNNLGYAFVRQNRLVKAEEWYHQALDENPTFFPAHLELARLYERTKRPAMAMKAYRRSIDFCIVCYEPVQALATLLIRGGKPEEARRVLTQFEKVEGITPEDRTRASQLLSKVTMAGIPATKHGG